MDSKHHFKKIEAALRSMPHLTPAFVLLPSQLMVDAFNRYIAVDRERAQIAFGRRIGNAAGLLSEVCALTQISSHPVLDQGFLSLMIHHIFAKDIVKGWKYFDPDLLREGRGYAKAFADVILELDSDGYISADTQALAKKHSVGRLHDVAAVWAAMDRMSSGIPLRGQLQRALKQKIDSTPEIQEQLARLLGPVIWLKTGDETRSTLDLLASITKTPGSQAIEISRLTLDEGLAGLAHPPLAALEGFQSAEGELEGMQHWLHRQLSVPVSAGAPNPDIAIIVPDDKIGAVSSFIAYSFDPELLYVAGSTHITAEMPLLGAVVEALSENLSARSMLEVLPRLKASLESSDGFEAGVRKSRDYWTNLINEHGLLGGTVADPDGASQWQDRLQARSPESAPFFPALNSFVELQKKVHSGAALAEIGSAFVNWCKVYLRIPVSVPTILPEVEGWLAQCAELTWMREISGREALEQLRAIVLQSSSHCGSFNQSRVVVGSLARLAGVPFTAIRMVGMTEGTFPATPREDSILPDSIRKELAGTQLRTSDYRVLKQRRDFEALLACKPTDFRLSCASQGSDASELAPSTLFFDILARHSSAPRLDRELQRLFHEGKERVRDDSLSQPISRKTVLNKLRALTKEGRIQLAPKTWGGYWHNSNAFQVDQAIDLHLSELDPKILSKWDGDGSDLSDAIVERLPGILENELHPSAMGSLLNCPMSFFLKNALGWGGPAELQETGSLSPLERGSMIHKILEWIYIEHPQPAKLRKLNEAKLRELSSKYVERAFEEFGHVAFLASEEARRREFEKATRATVNVLLADQKENILEVTTELEMSAKIKTAFGTLQINGTTDRLDTLVGPSGDKKKKRIVDYKSGRGKDEPVSDLLPGYDIQVVVYFLALSAVGTIKSSELESLEFRFPENYRNPQRSFSGTDLQNLLKSGRRWLDLIHAVLLKASFIRTLDPGVCAHCAYQDVCGKDPSAITQEKLNASKVQSIASLVEMWNAKK